MSDPILKITAIISRLAKYVITQVHAHREEKLWGPVVTEENKPALC